MNFEEWEPKVYTTYKLGILIMDEDCLDLGPCTTYEWYYFSLRTYAFWATVAYVVSQYRVYLLYYPKMVIKFPMGQAQWDEIYFDE